MPGPHVGLEDEGPGVRLERAQLRHVLRGLPVHHLAVVEGRLHEHGRVGLALQVGVGAIRLHVVVGVLLLGIAPLLVLAHGEGEAGVEHGVDDVHEGHVGDHGREQVRAHVGDGAHEQAARAAALDDEAAGRGVALGDEVLGHGDEVGERVPLPHHAAVVVPGLPHLAAPPHVRERDHHPAVEQAQPRGGEGDGQGEAVGAVAAQQHGGRSVPDESLPIDDRYGDLDPVGGGGQEALRGVLRPVVAAEHGRLLEQLRGARVHVVVEDRARGDQRLVGVAELPRLELHVGGGEDGVGGLGEGDLGVECASQAHHAQAGQALLALEPHVEVLEEVHRLQHDVGPMGEDLHPALAPGGGHGRLDEAEVAARVVDLEVEEVAVMVDVVLLVLDARREHRPFPARRLGGEDARLRGGEAPDAQDEPGAAARAAHPDVEGLVGLLVDELVRGRRAQLVTIEAVLALGPVLDRIEQRPAVGGPGHRARLLREGGSRHARAQVLDEQVVLAESGGVGGVGEEPAVVAHRVGAQGQEGVPLRQQVEVEGDLLFSYLRGGTRREGLLAAEDGVLLARLRPRVIEVRAVTVGDVDVRLLDAREHLRVQRALEARRGLRHRVRVRVLRLQVARHLGVALLAEPEVVVHAALPVHHVDPGDPLGHGRCGDAGLGVGERVEGRVRHRDRQLTAPSSARAARPRSSRAGPCPAA